MVDTNVPMMLEKIQLSAASNTKVTRSPRLAASGVDMLSMTGVSFYQHEQIKRELTRPTWVNADAAREYDGAAYEAAQDDAAAAGSEHADAQEHRSFKVRSAESVVRGTGLVGWVLERVIDAVPRRHAEPEGDEAGDEGDDERLDLEQSHVADDERSPRPRQVKLAYVCRSREARSEVHLEVALQVEEDRDEDEELLDADEDGPVLETAEYHAGEYCSCQAEQLNGQYLRRV